MNFIMRVLVLSDIHSNIVALETILQNAPGYDAVWCLGDVVGYGPAPNECVVRLRGLDAVTLAGNHDRAVTGQLPLAKFTSNARTALEWTITVLKPENRDWLAAREPKLVLAQHDVTLVHASLRDPVAEYIEDETVALKNFSLLDTSFCFFGHTHAPIAYRLVERERRVQVDFLPENQPYLMEPKMLLNPGSVGQPRDGDRRAAFAIYDTDTHLMMHHRREYDIAQTQRAMREAKLPPHLAARLAQGA